MRDGPAGRRLFVAVTLSIAQARRLADAAAQLARGDTLPGATWVPPANLHITLKFLGWTHEHGWTAVRDRLRRVADGERPFEIEVVGAGAFPDVTNANVFWAGVRDPSGRLAQLARKVEAELVDAGFAAEARIFVPHVTLARLRSPKNVAGVAAQLASQNFGTSTVREISLYESTVKSAGSEYTALVRERLGVAQRTTERQSGSVNLRAPDQEEPDHGRDRPEGAREGD